MNIQIRLLILSFTLFNITRGYNQQVFNSDVHIEGSLQIGTGAASGYNFGFDTFVMTEDNLRMYFDDTSASGSFPANDWRFTFNDSSNGGSNFFSIDDVTGGRSPFRIDAGATNNSLYIESGGNVGFGTNNPAVNLHNVEGNTPTLRLEQDGSSGFTPQSWDLAGNEANFFIRDVTNGSRLPFRIQPNTPDNTITLRASGTVGVGTFSPNTNASIHMSATDKGILVNRMTTAERGTFEASLGANENGMMVYDNEENKLYTWDGTQWITPTDDQVISLTNNTLTIENGGTVDLSTYLDNTDAQDLSLTNNVLSLTNDGTTVDLASYLDNTDAQELTLNNATLGITGGNTVDLSSVITTNDDQNLTSAILTNNELTITIENGTPVTVDLSAILTPLQDENITQQTQIDDLIARMEAIEACACQLSIHDELNGSGRKAILYQNIPNPFKNTSTIKYYLPTTITKAVLVFNNTVGQIVSKVTLEDRGEGELNVNSDGLPAAVYYYTLYTDGKKIDTKKMVIN